MQAIARWTLSVDGVETHYEKKLDLDSLQDTVTVTEPHGYPIVLERIGVQYDVAYYGRL